MEFRRLSHCVYHCEYHIVLTTKYRKPIFNEGTFAYIKLKLENIHEHYPYLDITIVNHDKDHIHLQMNIPPTMSVGKVVGIIKQNTAKEMKQKFPFVKEVYWGTDSVWSEGYFVSTVGINDEVIRRYIENQGNQDAGQTKFEIR